MKGVVRLPAAVELFGFGDGRVELGNEQDHFYKPWRGLLV